MPDASAVGVRWRPAAPFALIEVAGADAVDFVQRLCTQDVAGAPVGTSRPAAFLNAKGKLQATCVVGRQPAAVDLLTAADRSQSLIELLDRYHFSERLTLAPIPDLSCVEFAGVGAASALGVRPGSSSVVDGVRVFAGARHGIEWVRAFGPAAALALPPWDGSGHARLDDDVAEYLRIRRLEPLVGVDTDPTTLALEAGLDDHVSLTKGCYTGQEIVARINTYGHVNRRLCLLLIDTAEAPAFGTTLVEPDEGDAVGRVMSSAPVPSGERYVALGYLPADFWAADSELRVGGLDGAVARVVGV